MTAKRLIAGGAILLALAASAVAVAWHHGAPAIAVERGVVYASIDNQPLLLDLALPAGGDGPFPVVVFLHGGGWSSGKRQDMDPLIEDAARHGYAGVTVDYRLVPAARFPAPVEDCKAAVRWLRANAGKYHLRADRIGVVGFSAGGHLASMLGVTHKQDGFDGSEGNTDQSSRVQAVVSFFGPADFLARDWSTDLDRDVVQPFLGGAYANRADIYRRASPVTYVTPDAPPFLLFHGSADALVPVEQSVRMGDKLKSVGVAVEVNVFEGEGHGFTDANKRKATQRMLDFLDARLKR